MGAIASGIQETFNDVINNYGMRVIINARSGTFTAGDYDEASYSTTGSSIGSAFFLPVSERQFGQDQQFINMGLIRMDDVKMFLPSGIAIDENDMIAVAVGPNTGSYSIIRIFDYVVEDGLIYKKCYLRRFTV